MNNIIDLRETSPNHWQAKYQGNYGIYTIKINTDGKHRNDFSCSCPSDRYPCKHIAMIEEAIAERIAKNAKVQKGGKGKEMSAGELLKKLSHEELYQFTARIIQNNPDLSNAVLLEFAEKIETNNDNKYIPIIRRALEVLEFDEEDYYDDEMGPDIDILDQWFEKARQYLKEKKSREAVLVAQACIGEYALWLEQLDNNMIEYISEEYQSIPFEILEKAAVDPEVDVKALYDYCMAEIHKKKYSGLAMLDGFHHLLMKVSAKVNPDAFIALQYNLFNELQDKSSYGAKHILERIIDFYKSRHQPGKAWKCVEENIQIASFRKMVVEKKIKQKEFTEAKKLIHDYIDQFKEQNKHYSDDWDDFILQIAQQEKDTPTIRDVSYSFIKGSFTDNYYRIYKSTFNPGEWTEEFEKLFRHYENEVDSFTNPAADLLSAEGEAERLMEYIEKELSTESLEKYYRFFASAFPEKTLALFRKAIDQYAEKNVGRTYYEHIVGLFRKMAKIQGGDAVVDDMKSQYKIKYKNRRAMMEMLKIR
jgi:uncharacterized Zn finger protein